MKHLRFSTAQQVVEAFPSLRDHIPQQNLDLDPFTFIDDLLKADAAREAMAFCAFLLPRREAVQWACRALRKQTPPSSGEEADLLELAEEWARKPSEQSRVAALQAGLHQPQRASGWAALAAGWSGGGMLPNVEQPFPSPPHLTGHAVYAALSLMVSSLPFTDHISSMRELVADAVSMLRRGDA